MIVEIVEQKHLTFEIVSLLSSQPLVHYCYWWQQHVYFDKPVCLKLRLLWAAKSFQFSYFVEVTTVRIEGHMTSTALKTFLRYN